MSRLRSDAELIVASRDDPRAFRELYDRWAQPLLVFFYRRVRSHEVAADLLAETFAAALESCGRFHDVGKPGGAWLYGIARRELSHYFRRLHVELRAVHRLGIEVPAVDEESAAAIERLIEGEEHRAELERAMARMSDAERDAVSLRVIAETQATLDRLGWHGWTARAQQRPRTRGACGAFEGTGAAYSDPGASLDAQNRVVWIVSGR